MKPPSNIKTQKLLYADFQRFFFHLRSIKADIVDFVKSGAKRGENKHLYFII